MKPRTGASIVAEVIDNGEVSRQQILVIGICMLLNMLDGFDITAMAVISTAVSQELLLQPDQLGLVFSSALAGMMIGAMFLAPTSDLIGRRKVIILSVSMVGISILLTANAMSLTEFIVLRFISGLGAGAMLASQAAITAEYSPEKYRSLSVTLATAGYAIGAMMTSVVAGFIQPEYGWRGMFWFGGSITLVLGIVSWAFIPESLQYLLERRPADGLKRVNKILRKLKKGVLTELPEMRTQSAKQRNGISGNVMSLVTLEYRQATLALWSAFLLCFATLYFLMSWIPLLMERAGYSIEDGRLAFLMFNLGGTLGVLILGAMSIRWKLTNLVLVFLFSCSISMVVFAIAPGQRVLILVMLGIIGFLLQGGFVGLYAVAAKVYPTEIRSTGIGWCVGLGRAGAVIGPAAAGLLIAAGLSMSTNFLIFALPIAVAGILAAWLSVK